MLDFSKRYNDELITVDGKIEAVSVRTRSMKIKGEWYRLTDKTLGAKQIDLVRAGLNVELTYKMFRKPGVEIRYIQSIEVKPEPEYEPIGYEQAVRELYVL